MGTFCTISAEVWVDATEARYTGKPTASTVVRADNVLFSPASSSFDRYKNFVERRKAFDDLFFEL